MSTMQQRGLHSGLLPPRRELFLEIQVNKLINEFLYPRSAEIVPSSHHKNATLELREKKNTTLQTRRPDYSCTVDVKANTACDVFHMAHMRNPNEPVQEALVNVQSLDVEGNAVFEASDMAAARNPSEQACSPQEETLAKEEACSVQAANAACETSPEVHKGAHLSRLGTFPCANYSPNTHTEFMVNAEVKFSGKKPPRPPKLPKSSTPNQLARCSSYTSSLFLSVKRTKLQRKRKAAAAASTPSASTWALLCTFCFALLMLAQGFWSEGDSRILALDDSIASSPAGTNVKSVTLVTSQGIMKKYGQASVESGSHTREMVQGPRLLEPSQQEPDTSGKPLT